MRVPGAFRWVLERVLPAGEREAVVGDLEELFVTAQRRRGRFLARWWYRAEAIRMIGRFLLQSATEAWSRTRNGEGEGMMESVGRDLAMAVRALRKRWATSLWSIVALGMGIGLATTTFSIIWGSLLRGLPVEESDRLVHFERGEIGELGSLAVTHHDYLDWRARQTTFEDLGAYVEAVVTLRDLEGVPFRMEGLRTNRATFELLRVAPRVGRLFSDEEMQPGGPPVALPATSPGETTFLPTRGSSGGPRFLMEGRPRSSGSCRPALLFRSPKTSGCRSSWTVAACSAVEAVWT